MDFRLGELKIDNISFREATLDDLPILLEFEQGIIKAERPFTQSLKPDPITYYNLKDLIKSVDVFVVVAIHGSEIVASAYAIIRIAKPYKIFDKFGYLGFMYVRPEHRGKSLIQRVIQELKVWLKSQNISEVRLDVYDENDAAVNAYVKAGFKKHLVEMRMEI